MSRNRSRRWGLWETFIIGRQENPMMKRVRLIQTPIGGIYLHFIYREDLDPYPHDHPWNFFRMVLRGGYEEEYIGPVQGVWGRVRPFRPGYVPTDARHRITAVQPGTVSLVIVGRKRRTWGFWVPDTYHRMPVTRWVDYRDYLGLSKESNG